MISAGIRRIRCRNVGASASVSAARIQRAIVAGWWNENTRRGRAMGSRAFVNRVSTAVDS
jgi:hypothetical protein